MSDSPYGRIVRWLVYSVAVITPLLYLPWTSGYLEINKQVLLLAFASVGLIVWLLGVVVSGKLSFRSSPLDKGVAAFALVTIAATVLSVARGTSIFGAGSSMSSSLITVLALSTLYFLAVSTIHDRGRLLRTLFTASLFVALVVGLCQMLGWFFLPGLGTHAQAFNTVGSLNALGLLAAIALSLFAKVAARGGLPAMVFSVVGTVVALVTLCILNWWVLWAVALAGMLAMIAFDSLNVAQLGRFALSRFIVPVVVIVLGAFLLLIDFSPAALREKFPLEVSVSHRLSSRITKNVLKERPVLGYGPENFSLAFDRYGAGSLADTQMAPWRFSDGASEAFNTVVNLGALGLGALVLMGWCVVQVMARFGRAVSVSGSSAGESAGAMAALLASATAFFLYPFSLTLALSSTVLLVLAGLTVADARAKNTDIEDRPLWSLTASLGFIAALIVVLCAVYFISVRYLADLRYAKAIRSPSSQTATQGLLRAIDLWPSDDRALRDASQVTLQVLREEAAKKDKDDERPQRVQNLMAAAIQLAQRAAQVAPREPANWNNLGSVYQSLTGLVENVEQLAEDAYRKAADLRPGDPTYDNEIGSLWLARADLIRSISKTMSSQLQQQYTLSLSRAEEAFKRAITTSPTYGMAIYNLGAVYDRQGKVNDAILQLESIAPYNSNEPTLMFELGLLYIRAGKKDLATSAMRRAVLLSPQYANARWYLALLLENAGDLDGSLAQLNELEKTNTDNAELKTKIGQIQSGIKAKTPVIDNQPIE